MKTIIGPLILATLVAASCLTSTQCDAQSNYRFHHYNTRDGLASETVDQIVQDSLGFIWIKYYGGLSRFDGYNFKIYQFDPLDSLKSIGSGRINYIFLDGSKNLWVYRWVGGDGEVPKRYFSRYDRSTDSFVSYLLELKTDRISPCFDTSNSTIWIGGNNGYGLYAFNYITNKSETYFNHHSDSLINAARNSYRGVVDQGSFLLLATRSGLWKFDKREMKFSRPLCDPSDSVLLYHNPISLSRLSSNKMDVGIGDDRYHLDNSLSKMTRIENPPSLSQYSKSSEAWAADGIVWVGTRDKGLFRFDPINDSITNITSSADDPYSLKSNWLNHVMIDRDQNIWVGTQERGVSVLRKQDLTFQNSKIGGFGSTLVFEADKKDYLLVARTDTYPPRDESVYELLVTPFPKGNLQSLDFQKIRSNTPIKGYPDFAMGQETFWVGLYGDGILGFRKDDLTTRVLLAPRFEMKPNTSNPNTISSSYAYRVFEDKNRDLWVTFEGEGMNKIKHGMNYGEEGSVEKFVHSDDDPYSISNNIVIDVQPGTDNSLWAFTFSGIDRFRDGKFERVFSEGVPNAIFESQDSVIYIGTSDGLYVSEGSRDASKFRKDMHVKGAVLKIKEDRLGRLWLSNLEGIICYDPKEQIALYFTEQEGVDHTHGIIHAASDGTFVTANIEGISIFDPQSLSIDRKKTLPVLTKLLINNNEPKLSQVSPYNDDYRLPKDISVLDELTIDHKHNNFSIEFSAMEMTAPEKNLYRHKLEGYDDDWIETDSKNRTATYTNLDAGTYTFRVKASNHHGVWSDNQRTLTVTILPPPWKTAWAYTGYSLIVLGLLFTARRTIVQRERLKGSLRLAKVEQEKEHFELEKAIEVDRVKTSFFTNISHEFRTPLTLIQGPVQDLLDKYSSEPKTKEKLKLIQRNSHLLLKLINQLLDLAKLDAGNLKVEKSNGEVMRFVRATGGSFASLAAQKDISIHINVPDEHCYALFDRDKLETILINLINNAIKFTPSHGSVHVSADVINNVLYLIVKDTGIGIPNDQHEKIFERFHQVSESHKEVGTGIGLALVKELVALLGGTIAVKSEVGKGSEFIVTLPLKMVSSEDHIETHEPELSIDQPTVHIVQNKITVDNSENHNGAEIRPQLLVVEDNADLRSFIIESLGNEFKFLEAENGRQGLEVATTEIPDLIISDVMMPEMDGITMAEKIKGDVRTSHIPLILLTAKSTEASKLTGLESGADDYLTKPFNKHELLLKIRNGITRQRKLREKVMAELMSEAPRKEVLSADEQFLAKVKEEILKELSNEQLSVESLAEQIGMSRVHLYRKISGLTGMSVNELIRKLRLHRAAQLLQQQWGPVSQVAYEVGFSNLSYFSKVFKEEFGVLPSEVLYQG